MKVKEINAEMLDWLLELGCTSVAEIGNAEALIEAAQVKLLQWMRVCQSDKELAAEEADYTPKSSPFDVSDVQFVFEAVESFWLSLPDLYKPDFEPVYLAIDAIVVETNLS